MYKASLPMCLFLTLFSDSSAGFTRPLGRFGCFNLFADIRLCLLSVVGFAVTVGCRIRIPLHLFVNVRRCPRRPSLLVSPLLGTALLSNAPVQLVDTIIADTKVIARQTVTRQAASPSTARQQDSEALMPVVLTRACDVHQDGSHGCPSSSHLCADFTYTRSPPLWETLRGNLLCLP